MGEAFESIMRGLGEVKAHREGKLKLTITAIEIAPLPVYDAEGGQGPQARPWAFSGGLRPSPRVAKKTVEAWESSRNVPNGAACRFLEVLRKDHGFIQRERIVTYAAKTSGVRAAAKRASSTSRVSAKKDAKAMVPKATVLR